MSENLLGKIVNFLIQEVQCNSLMSGFQCIVNYKDVEKRFGVQIDEAIKEYIIDALCKREEVADVIEDADGFDIVLYTHYAPNYNEHEI